MPNYLLRFSTAKFLKVGFKFLTKLKHFNFRFNTKIYFLGITKNECRCQITRFGKSIWYGKSMPKIWVNKKF